MYLETDLNRANIITTNQRKAPSAACQVSEGGDKSAGRRSRSVAPSPTLGARLHQFDADLIWPLDEGNARARAEVPRLDLDLDAAPA